MTLVKKNVKDSLFTHMFGDESKEDKLSNAKYVQTYSNVYKYT